MTKVRALIRTSPICEFDRSDRSTRTLPTTSVVTPATVNGSPRSSSKIKNRASVPPASSNSTVTSGTVVSVEVVATVVSVGSSEGAAVGSGSVEGESSRSSDSEDAGADLAVVEGGSVVAGDTSGAAAVIRGAVTSVGSPTFPAA